MAIPEAIKNFAADSNGGFTASMAVEAGVTVDNDGNLVASAEAIEALNRAVLAKTGYPIAADTQPSE